MRHKPGTPTQTAAGFSLLEVMISILILALGLLGILAAYPSVIELQRRAQDDVLGQGAAAAAESYLRNVIWENDQPVENDQAIGAPPPAVDPNFDPRSPREILQFDAGISSLVIDDPANPEISCNYEWAWDPNWDFRVPVLPGGSGLSVESTVDQALIRRGDLILGGGLDASQLPPSAFNAAQRTLDYIGIPVAARLFPEPGSGADPRYVWDVVFRRVDIGLEQQSSFDPTRAAVFFDDVPNMPLQAAVFVRRIDAGIAIPPEVQGDQRFTRAEALAGYFIETDGTGVNPGQPIPEEFRRVPVSGILTNISVNYGGLGSVPLQPTNDGRVGGNRGYSPIVGMPATVDPDGVGEYDVLAFQAFDTGVIADVELRRQAAKPRQILVDNTGGIREVVEILTQDFNGNSVAPLTRVRVDPPYSAGDALAGGVSQVVFTPQIPVAVRVVELRP